MSFKVGDRIRVATDRYRGQQGDTGVVCAILETMLPIRVRFDPGCHALTNAYQDRDLELLEPAQQPIEALAQDMVNEYLNLGNHPPTP